ncbi:hypothetical protein ACFQ0X_19850 [Streptomyces rectiviolaceus]|uniref:Uncharacterized protein n=1 Tax=Streptomyces rectiviolaceus TaxID=332591 RepID=A0ABP6M877_9ACTN
MPPEQAAALYLAASKIPGVELIFDKKTKEFLGERQVAVEDLPTGFKEGTVTGRSAVLERVVVDKAGQRP